ncbi:MAG: hypothetical protein ABRQ39_02655 [Candidatus Eremiobacterota bacterium]
MNSISGMDLKIFNCASGEIEALTDLWLKGMNDFIDYYSSIPEELLTRPIDKEGETAISAGKHVMGAALGHFKWSIELAGLTGPDKKSSLLTGESQSREQILDEAERLKKIIPGFISPMTNDHLSNQGTTSWGEHMSSEGMIEHTIVHLYRHIRQLKVRLYK